jgi:hypothetical protein
LASSSATTGSADRLFNSLAENTFLTFLIVPKAMLATLLTFPRKPG